MTCCHFSPEETAPRSPSAWPTPPPPQGRGGEGRGTKNQTLRDIFLFFIEQSTVQGHQRHQYRHIIFTRHQYIQKTGIFCMEQSTSMHRINTGILIFTLQNTASTRHQHIVASTMYIHDINKGILQNKASTHALISKIDNPPARNLSSAPRRGRRLSSGFYSW